MGPHALRHLKGSHICKPRRRIPILHLGIKQPHNEIFNKKRHHPDKGISLRSRIGGDVPPQQLLVQMITHIIVYLKNNLLKCVFPQPRIYPRIDHGDEIPQGYGREKTPQVHRHSNLYRALPAAWTLLLILQQGVQQNRIQILRNSGMISLGRRQYLRHGHDPVHDVQSIKGFRRPPDPIRLLLQPRRTYLGICITHIGVLQLPRIRLPMDIQHEALILDPLHPQQPQVGGCHGQQHAHASGAVSQTVVGLQSNSVPEIIDPHQIPIVRLEIHRLTRILHILLNKRPRSVVGF